MLEAWVFPRFSKAQRDKKTGAGRGLCVVSFVSGPCALEGSAFGLGQGFVLGEEKPPRPRASQGLPSAQASSCNHTALVPVQPKLHPEGVKFAKIFIALLKSSSTFKLLVYKNSCCLTNSSRNC